MIAETLILNELGLRPMTAEELRDCYPTLEEFTLTMALNTLISNGKIAYNTTTEEYSLIPRK